LLERRRVELMKQSAGQQDQIVWGDQLSSKSPGGGRRV